MQFLHEKRERAGLLIALLGVAILIALTPFASGLLGAAVLYVLAAPLYRRLQRALKTDLAAAVTLVIVILLFVLPLVWVIALLADQVPESLKSAQQSDAFSRLGALRVGRFQVGTELARAGGSILQWISGQALGAVGGAAKMTLNLVIAFFALYYMLTSSGRVWNAFREFIPFSHSGAEELKERFFSVTRATLLGTVVVALLQGSIVGVAFLLVGLPNALLWGIVAGVTSILPVLGTALVWLPGVIVLLVGQRYGQAIVLLIVGGVIASNVDNLIRPMIYKRVSDIHPLVTLVGAFAGVQYFGLLGVLLGPLAIQYFFELLQLYQEEYLGPQRSGGGGSPQSTAAARPDRSPAQPAASHGLKSKKKPPATGGRPPAT